MDIAVAYFAYRRFDKVSITLQALLKCEGIENMPVIIFQDNAIDQEDNVNVNKTRSVINQIITQNTNVKFEYNLWKKHVGSEMSLITGISYALNKYGCVIRIEEDIEVRPDFLLFMKTSLERYRNDPRIFAICSFNPRFRCGHNVFLARPLRVWGCGLWADRFNKEVWNKKYIAEKLGEKNSEELFELFPYSIQLCCENLLGLSWDKVMEDRMLMYYCFVKELYCVYPDCSYVRNIGFDGSGVHSGYKLQENTNLNKIVKLTFDDYILNKDEELELINTSIRSYHADF